MCTNNSAWICGAEQKYITQTMAYTQSNFLDNGFKQRNHSSLICVEVNALSHYFYLFQLYQWRLMNMETHL